MTFLNNLSKLAPFGRHGGNLHWRKGDCVRWNWNRKNNYPISFQGQTSLLCNYFSRWDFAINKFGVICMAVYRICNVGKDLWASHDFNLPTPYAHFKSGVVVRDGHGEDTWMLTGGHRDFTGWKRTTTMKTTTTTTTTTITEMINKQWFSRASDESKEVLFYNPAKNPSQFTRSDYELPHALAGHCSVALDDPTGHEEALIMAIGGISPLKSPRNAFVFSFRTGRTKTLGPNQGWANHMKVHAVPSLFQVPITVCEESVWNILWQISRVHAGCGVINFADGSQEVVVAGGAVGEDAAGTFEIFSVTGQPVLLTHSTIMWRYKNKSLRFLENVWRLGQRLPASMDLVTSLSVNGRILMLSFQVSIGVTTSFVYLIDSTVYLRYVNSRIWIAFVETRGSRWPRRCRRWKQHRCRVLLRKGRLCGD